MEVAFVGVVSRKAGAHDKCSLCRLTMLVCKEQKDKAGLDARKGGVGETSVPGSHWEGLHSAHLKAPGALSCAWCFLQPSRLEKRRCLVCICPSLGSRC